MDIPTINDCLMQIGTDNKQQNIETANGRIKSGAKGIGRFALNRLGSKAIMYTHKDGQDAFSWKVGTPLFEFCQTRHGIATLSNKTYIFLPNKEDDKYYYLEKEDVSYPIEKTLCKDIVNSNKLNSEKALVDLVHKAIFPYVIDKSGKAVLIKEEVIQAKYPCAYSYLQSQRETLDKRDKGKVGDYPAWYAYGRTQSLVMPAIKIFFPKIANKPLNCVIVENSNLLLYNGMAFVGDDMRKMKILQKVLESDIFWNYVVANSKPYTSGYYSLNGSNIKNFGVPKFTKAEEEELLRLEDKGAVNQWLSSFYE